MSISSLNSYQDKCNYQYFTQQSKISHMESTWPKISILESISVVTTWWILCMHVRLKVNALFLQVMIVQVYKDIIHIVASCQDLKLHK